MNKENKFYVYIHRRVTDNRIFYVGKGHSKRAFSLHDRNNHWHNIKNKHGFIVEIISDSLSESEAFQLEINTISAYKELGYSLCNMTNGGEGTSGLKQSPDHIAKRVAKNTGRKRHTDEIEKSRESLIGHRLSNETIEKLRFANISAIVFGSIVNTLKNYNKTPSRLNLNISGILNSSADMKVYTFQRIKDGLIFVGSRMQIRDQFKLKQSDFDKLFYVKGRITSQGWKILKETNGNN